MTSSPPPTAQVLADAATRRLANTQASNSGALLMQEYEKRQMFRRLIDPGIFRPNSREVAMGALKTLTTMAENILREPENAKYHSFKRENDIIKRRLIEPKGALEYALELGFRPKVDDFQSHYVFNPSRMDDLRIGAAILKEALDRETEREERARRDREQQKATAGVVAQNVKLAFLEDRQRKMVRDQREREARAARESAQVSSSAVSASSPLLSEEQSISPMPGVGHTLATTDNDSIAVDQPPPYDD